MLANIKSPVRKRSNEHNGFTSAELLTQKHHLLMAAAAASSGSSPSREVQDILLLKDSDCLNQFYDEQDEQIDGVDEEFHKNKNNIEKLSCNLKKIIGLQLV